MSKLLEVYDLTYKKLCVLNDNSPVSATMPTVSKSLNQVDTLTFKMPLQSDKWNYILNQNLVKFDNEFYFIITPTFSDSEKEQTVDVKCLHLSSSLGSKLNEEINEIGKSCDELMRIVLDKTGWTVGTISGVSNTKFRNLESKEVTVFSNLVTIAEKFDAYLRFNSISKTVDMIANGTIDRSINIVRGKNIKDISVEYDSSELVTRLYCIGGKSDITGNEISIMKVNPTGKSYIENYTFFLNSGYTLEYINAHPELFLREQVWNASEYEDGQELMFYEDAVKKLNQLAQPKMSIKVGALDFVDVPMYFTQTPIVGERVLVIDPILKLKISAQVTSISKNYEDDLNISIEISNIITYEDLLKNLVDNSKAVNRIINPIGTLQASYIDGVLNLDKARLNSGNSGISTTIEGALVIETPNKLGCIKFNNGMFGIGTRTQAQKDAGIDYDFRTFGTPEGFSAEFITTGILNGGGVHLNLDNAKSYELKDRNGVPYILPPSSFLIGDSIEDYKLFFNGQTQEFLIRVGSVEGLDERLETIDNEIDDINTDIGTINNNISTINGNISSINTRVQNAELAVSKEAIVSKVSDTFSTISYVNSLSVGGKNLLLNTAFTNATGYKAYSSTISVSNGHLVITGNGSSDGVETTLFNLKANQKYILSFKTNSTNSWAYMYLRQNQTTTIKSFNVNLVPVNGKVVFSFTHNADINNANLLIGWSSGAEVREIWELQLEEGDLATNWTPSPQDISNEIDTKVSNAQSSITQTTNAITSRVETVESFTKQSAIRYIRSWLNGSNVNTANCWVELEVFVGNTNIAQGKLPTASGTFVNLQYYTDGVKTDTTYVNGGTGWQWLQIDLGSVRNDIDYITEYHYFSDGRKFNHKLEVSVNGDNWYKLYDSTVQGVYAETAKGKTYYTSENSIAGRFSEIKQTTDGITLSVASKLDSNKVISQINASTEGIKISGDKVNITGFVTFSDLNTSGKTTINGSNITTGTIDASKVTISSLVVGQNVTMGANATISWNQVTNQPYIPSGYSDTQAVNAIKSTFIDANGVWTPKVYAGNIVAGELKSMTIKGGTITGEKIIVDSVLAFMPPPDPNYLLDTSGWLKFYKNPNNLNDYVRMYYNELLGLTIGGSTLTLIDGLTAQGRISIQNSAGQLGVINVDQITCRTLYAGTNTTAGSVTVNSVNCAQLTVNGVSITGGGVVAKFG